MTTPLLPVDTMDKVEINPDSGKFFLNFILDFSPQLQKAVVKVSKELETFSVRSEDLTLDKQIGSGSSGQVFKGTFMGSTVAVKRCLIVDLLEDPLKDFMSETQIMSSFRHPNVVQFIGATIKPPHFYIITEYCENGNFETVLKKEKLSMRQKTKMLLDCALGMYYLYKNNIIHRDLKLSNLLVDREFNIKVADFGSSRILRKDSERMTKVGTIDVSPPEVLKNGIYNMQTDIYSFGILLWQVIYQKPLYPNMNVYEITSGVVKGLRPSIPDNQEVPKELITIMKLCWNESQYKRPKWEDIISTLQKIKKELEEKEILIKNSI